jgi:hypothetical protein
MIELDLNTNDAEALLRNAEGRAPNTGDPCEGARLADALADLVEAINRPFKRVD